MKQFIATLFKGFVLVFFATCISCSDKAALEEEVELATGTEEEPTTHTHHGGVNLFGIFKVIYGEQIGEEIEIKGIAHLDSNLNKEYEPSSLWYIETEDGARYYIDGYEYTPKDEMLAVFKEGVSIAITGKPYWISEKFMGWFYPEMLEMKQTMNLYVMDLWNCNYQREN